MKQILAEALQAVALEESIANEKYAEDFESVMLIPEYKLEYDYFQSEYNVLVDTVHSFEKIQETIVNSKYSEDKTNYAAIKEIIDTLALRIQINPETLKIVSIEGWNDNSISRSEQKQITLESIADFIKKIWEAIKRFVMGIYNWIKNLIQLIKSRVLLLRKKSDKINEDVKKSERKAQTMRYAVDEVTRMKKSPIYAKNRQDIEDIVAKYETDAKGRRTFDSRTVFEENREPVKDSFKKSVATEDINGGDLFIDSLFRIMDETSNKTICYSSRKANFLLTSKKAHELMKSNKSTDVDDVIKTLTATQQSLKTYFDTAERVFLPALKDAIRVLSSKTYDEKTARSVLEKVFPTPEQLSGYISESKVLKEGNLVEFNKDKLAFYAALQFSTVANVEDLIESINNGKPTGSYLTGVKFTAATLKLMASTPLIALTPNVSDKDISTISDKLTKDLFLLFSDLSDFSSRYQNVVEGLNRAINMASRDTDNPDANKLLAFARTVLHAMNTYVNQPLVSVNDVLPRMIDAALDYVDCYLVCKDPAAYISAF